MRRADIGASAASQAVVQPKPGCAFQIAGADAGRHVQRQKVQGANMGASAAADAILLVGFAAFGGGERQHAAATLDDGRVERGQGHAHHRAAHHQALRLFGEPAAKFDQRAHRRADRDFDIARLAHGQPGHGHDAMGQRLAKAQRAVNRVSRADVVHQHADAGHARAGG